jgi:hypothetical protein
LLASGNALNGNRTGLLHGEERLLSGDNSTILSGNSPAFSGSNSGSWANGLGLYQS